MGHMYVKGHHRLATSAKLKSAADGKEPNDHEMNKVTITKKSVLKVGRRCVVGPCGCMTASKEIPLLLSTGGPWKLGG